MTSSIPPSLSPPPQAAHTAGAAAGPPNPRRRQYPTAAIAAQQYTEASQPGYPNSNAQGYVDPTQLQHQGGSSGYPGQQPMGLSSAPSAPQLFTPGVALGSSPSPSLQQGQQPGPGYGAHQSSQAGYGGQGQQQQQQQQQPGMQGMNQQFGAMGMNDGKVRSRDQLKQPGSV